jgi:vancomycin resistance protein YoaR
VLEKFKEKLKFNKPSLKTLKVPLLVVYVILGLFSFYHIVFAHRIIPGVKVGNVGIGGLTYSQAKNVLEEQKLKAEDELKLKFGDKIIPIKMEDIGFYYDWDLALANAFKIGRTGDLMQDTSDKLLGPFTGLSIESFYDYDNNSLSTRFSSIKGEVNIEPISAGFELVEDELLLTPSENGQKVMDKELYRMVMESFDKVDFGEKEVPVVLVEPKITDEELKPYWFRVDNMIKRTITVVYEEEIIEEKPKEELKDDENEDRDIDEDEPQEPPPPPEKKYKVIDTWELDKVQILDFISYEKNDQSGIDIVVNEPKFNAFAETVMHDVNKLPRGQVTETDGDKVVKFEITEPGYEVDDEEFKKDFVDVLLDGKDEVKLTLIETQKSQDKDKYGIVALLGEGRSNFTGSIQGRINNLTLAASRTDGVLVPPDQVYSMNDTIGEISGRTGYDIAWIIKSGRTVLGEGGGVCQTSTTLFRAVLDSGLPVVKRYPHAYRVHYYEHDSPVGIDASIYQPSIDFQFRNDTPNYVLVQTNWDLESKTLVFRIYGTPDGRTVEMTEPVVTNQSPPPEPVYEDDPTLPKGTIKQIDWAAWGATASFSRVVEREGEILHEDTYTTRYQPWRAVYLRGTKEN